MRALSRSEPNNARYLAELASLYRSVGDLENARKATKQALEHAPEVGMARGLAEIEQVILQMLDGNHLAATATLEKLTAQNPSSRRVLMLLGDSYFQQQKFDDAEQRYTAAQDLFAGGEVAVKIFESRLEQGRKEAAIQVLVAWLEANPNDVAARLAGAFAWHRTGDVDRAVDEYRRVLALDPEHITATNNLAWLLFTKGELEEARVLAGAGYERSPEDIALADTYGWILASTGDLKTSKQILEQVVQKAPRLGTSRYHLSVVLTKLGDISAATRELDTLLESDVEFPERGEAERLRARL
jgi:Flp pilus assembly protein TadD